MNFKYILAKIIKKVQISAVNQSDLDKYSKISSMSNIKKISLGKYSYIGNNCTIVDVEIGNFCSIADNCIIGGASHAMHWASTSPVFNEGKNILKMNFSKHEYQTTKRTFIGNDVWIGNNCLIKSGVKISNGAVIGMGSVVTKDIGSYEVWAGNPAKIINKRFSDEIINELEASKWWNLPDTEIKNLAIVSNDISKFLGKLKGGLK